MTDTISASTGADEGIDGAGADSSSALASLLDREPDYDQPADPLEGDTASALLYADRHLRHVARIEAQMQQVAAIAASEMERIEDWHKAQARKLEARRLWHLIPLRGLHAAILRDNPKRKTIELPHGTLKSRTYEKPKLSIENDNAVMAWMLANHADALEPKRPGVQLIGKYVDVLETIDGTYCVVDCDTDAAVPGLSAKVPEPTFDVDTSPTSEF